MGGSAVVWKGAFQQAGVVQVQSAEELIDTIYSFLYLPPAAGPRVAVMGGGGAISVAASDSLERLGLSVPYFSPSVLQKLKSSFPPVGNSLRNPVDLGNPMIPPSMLRKVMEAAEEDDGIDTLIVIQILFYIMYQVRHRMGMDGRPLSQFSFQPELLKACQEVKARSGKPVILVMPDITTDGQMIDLELEWRRERDIYQAAGFPVFRSLDRAARALGHVVSFYARD
jgi:acetyltransferase